MNDEYNPIPVHTPEAINICKMMLRWGKIINNKNTLSSEEEIIDQYAAEIDALRTQKVVPRVKKLS